MTTKRRWPTVLWTLLVSVLLPMPALSQSALRIVAVVPAAANSTVPDEDGDYPAYIDLQALQTRELNGHFLSNDPQFPGRWPFPQGYTIAAGQTLRVFASGKDRRPTGPGGRLHTSFTYDCDVPYCGVANPQLTVLHTFVDRVDRCACDGMQLIARKASARVLIPTEDIGLDWTLPGFNDKKWIRAVTGIGYEVGTSPFLEGLVLYHTYDKAHVDGQSVRDVSGPFLHTGAASQNPTLGIGRVSEGYRFPGEASTFVRTPHHEELNPGLTSFSVGFWFRPQRGGTAGTTPGPAFSEVILAKHGNQGTAGSPVAGWSAYRNANGTFVQVVSSFGVRTVALGLTPADQWHHVMLVVDRSAVQIVGYLNGKRMGIAVLGGATENIVNTADLLEGRDQNGTAPFAGVLDDVAVWRRAFSDAQVGQLFSAGQQGKSFLDGGLFPGSGNLYAGLINTDVLTPMRDINSSCYIRIPFNLPAVSATAVGLKLRIHYNDGFIAYLNGAEVARRNAPDPADFLAASTVDRPDTAALVAETIDLSSSVGLLRPGGNVLAFHALTHSPNSDRFLLAPAQLCLEVIRTPTTPGGECVRETNGRDFWVTFPQNYVQEPDTPLHLTLCIAGIPQTKGIVEIPGINAPGFPRLFTIPPSGSIRITLPRAAELSGPDNVEKKGVHILATSKVAVYGTTRMDFTTDTFLALPTSCIGTEYLISTFRNVFDGIPILNGSQFAIVAVADGTEVTVVPPAKVGVHPPLVPYVVKLQRGETYQLRQEANRPADLTGTSLKSNKPISVFGSHRCANIQSVNQFFCDTIVEQLLPLPLWGSTFFVVPLETRASDTVRVLSSANDNLVTVTTLSGAQSFVLQRGEFKDLVLDKASRIDCRAASSVMQFSNSSDADHVVNADPFMTLIQPFNTWLTQYRFCTPPASEFESNYLHLITQSGSTLDFVQVNGTPLSVWNPAEISKGALPTGFAYARLKLSPNTTYLVQGVGPVGMIAYGYSEFDSYGYPGGMVFQGSPTPIFMCPPDITVDCQPIPGTTANSCAGIVPDLRLRAEVFDACSDKGQVAVTQKPAPGTALPPGTHTITLLAADGTGKTVQCDVRFVVQGSWPSQNFSPNVTSNPALEATVWGRQADPDRDGLPNAMEEALGTSPNVANPMNSIVEIMTEQDDWGVFPIVRLPRLATGEGPAVELEGVASLDGSPWDSGPDLLEELPGRNTGLPGGKHEKAVYRIREPLNVRVGQPASYFLRLRLKE